MDDDEIDAVRQSFAELTVQFENAAMIAAAGQGVKSLESGRRRLRRLSIATNRIRERLASLSGRPQ